MPPLNTQDAKKLYDAFVKAIASEPDLRALQPVSEMIAGLQAAGIDAGIEWHNAASDAAFNLDIGANVSSWKQRTSGILRIASAQHLIALCSEVQLHSDEDKQWHKLPLLGVSVLDLRHQQDAKWRTRVFRLDVAEDLTEMQKFIIERAAVAEAIARNDTQGVFASTRRTEPFSVTAPRISLKPKGA